MHLGGSGIIRKSEEAFVRTFEDHRTVQADDGREKTIMVVQQKLCTKKEDLIQTKMSTKKKDFLAPFPK